VREPQAQQGARLGQELALLDRHEAEVRAALDDAQFRHIAQAAVSASAPIHVAKPHPRALLPLAAGGGKGADEATKLQKLGIPVVATPAIRRGKDVVFHSAAAGEEVVLKSGWTRQGTRKSASDAPRVRREGEDEEDEDEEEAAKVAREKDVARRSRLRLLEKNAAALRADIKVSAEREREREKERET